MFIRLVFKDVCYSQKNNLLILKNIVYIAINSLKLDLYIISKIIFINRNYCNNTNVIDNIVVIV